MINGCKKCGGVGWITVADGSGEHRVPCPLGCKGGGMGSPYLDAPELNPLTFDESLANLHFIADARTTVPRLVKALQHFRREYWSQTEAMSESSAIADDQLAMIDARLLAILEDDNA